MGFDKTLLDKSTLWVAGDDLFFADQGSSQMEALLGDRLSPLVAGTMSIPEALLSLAV